MRRTKEARAFVLREVEKCVARVGLRLLFVLR